MKTKKLFLAVLLVTLTGCTALPMRPVSSRSLAPTPRSAARSDRRPINTPLYLVLDPNAVPDTAIIGGEGPRGGMRVTEIREFVRTHLRSTLGRHFQRVEVVAPEDVPRGGHVAIVRVSRVGLTGHRNGEIYGQIAWSFSLRSASGDMPVFRFAETSTGDAAVAYAEHGEQTIESTYRVALEHLDRALGDGEVPARLLASEQAPIATSPTQSL
jgi:hypothetical protein